MDNFCLTLQIPGKFCNAACVSRRTLQGVFFAVMVAAATVNAWIDDATPNSIQGRVGHLERFPGNDTYKDYFKILERDGDSLLVGARNMVYNISLHTLHVNRRIEWNSSPDVVKTCLMKGKHEDECHNYIRVLVKEQIPANSLAQERVLICGTNAFKPMCRNYSKMNHEYEVVKEFEGQAICPYDPNDNNTAVIVGGELYTATVADFPGSDALIYRPNIRTVRYDNSWLNQPNFVSSFEFGAHVYFLFRETAVEYTNCGKVVYPRVARVCKNDRGGSGGVLDDNWTTFLKARLNCSVPGDYPFYFNEIEDTSTLLQSTQYGGDDHYLYGLFTTPLNSIAGSAICLYRMRDVLSVFASRFKYQLDPNHNWLPVPSMDVPEPRPGQCTNDSRRLPRKTRQFIMDNHLMNEAVPAVGGRPIVLQTSRHFRFTKVAVHARVRAVNGKLYDVLFIGTDDGKVLKALNSETENEIRTTIVEELTVFAEKYPVTNLHVYSDDVDEKLVVVSHDEIVSIPLHRCHVASNCGQCVNLQDPYCAWDRETNNCAYDPDRLWDNSGAAFNEERFIQNVRKGTHWMCPNDTHTTAYTLTGDRPMKPIVTDSNNNVIFDPSGPKALESAIHHSKEFTGETLALAVTIAILLALLVGFLVGYRFRMWHKADNLCSGTDPRTDKCRLENGELTTRSDPSETFLTNNGKSINVMTNFVKTPNSKMPNSCADNKPISKSNYPNKVYL